MRHSQTNSRSNSTQPQIWIIEPNIFKGHIFLSISLDFPLKTFHQARFWDIERNSSTNVYVPFWNVRLVSYCHSHASNRNFFADELFWWIGRPEQDDCMFCLFRQSTLTLFLYADAFFSVFLVTAPLECSAVLLLRQWSLRTTAPITAGTAEYSESSCCPERHFQPFQVFRCPPGHRRRYVHHSFPFEEADEFVPPGTADQHEPIASWL